MHAICFHCAAQKRAAKEARDAEALAKLVATKGAGSKEVEAKKKAIEAAKGAAARGSAYYRVTVKVRGMTKSALHGIYRCGQRGALC